MSFFEDLEDAFQDAFDSVADNFGTIVENVSKAKGGAIAGTIVAGIVCPALIPVFAAAGAVAATGNPLSALSGGLVDPSAALGAIAGETAASTAAEAASAASGLADVDSLSSVFTEAAAPVVDLPVDIAPVTDVTTPITDVYGNGAAPSSSLVENAELNGWGLPPTDIQGNTKHDVQGNDWGRMGLGEKPKDIWGRPA